MKNTYTFFYSVNTAKSEENFLLPIEELTENPVFIESFEQIPDAFLFEPNPEVVNKVKAFAHGLGA